MGVEIRRKASWTSCLRGKLTQHLSPLCPIQGLIFSQQTWGWHPESPQTRKELHGRGREDTSGSLRRLAFVSSDKKNRNRKCYRATVWREWGTKWRKQANAADSMRVILPRPPAMAETGGLSRKASTETCQRSHFYLLQRTGTKMQLNGDACRISATGTTWNYSNQTTIFPGNLKLVFDTNNSHRTQFHFLKTF